MTLKFSKILTAAVAAALFAAPASAELLPYKSPMPRVPTVWEATPYDTVLKKTWEGVLKRNVNAYSTGLVHRPKSETPGDAVSEGVGYGMFLALYCNDQASFNKIWNAGEKYMWSDGGQFYDWRVNQSGAVTGRGPASDADQDIALLLIFANELVKNRIWTAYTSEKKATYEERARDILKTVRTSMVASNGALLPGHWGDNGIINPGYFAPAFYRVFAEFDPDNKAAWDNLVNACYTMIPLSPGYSRGLIPDWFNFEGKSTGGAGYNAYFNGDALYRDAIRVYWRLGIDYLWYGEPRAKTFLDNAVKFIENEGGPDAVNFYTMEGKLLPEKDTEGLKGGAITRSRREHSHLTAGMWAAAAIGSGDTELAKKYGDKLLEFYRPGTDYWGHAVDPTGGRMIDGELVPEDTLRNETYFDQFLAWFGASMLGGVFTNVWEDLKDGIPPSEPLAWKSRPDLDTQVVDASKKPLRVTASFNHAARWTIEFKHDQTGATSSISGRSEEIDALWYGLSETGSYMPQGMYTVTVKASSLSWSAKMWLGRPWADSFIEANGRLLVDDFEDGDLVPNVGRVWTHYLDSFEGKNGTSTGELSVGPHEGSRWLSWKYSLSGGDRLGYDPHAALEWNCQTASGTSDLRGLDTIIVRARGASGSIGVSVQLISSDFNSPHEYQYFEDSMKLSTTSTEYKLPISRFKQRAGGSGKNLQTTLSKMTGIRFQVQYPDGATNTIMLERMYFTGTMPGFYKHEPPPEYLPPNVDIPISVKHRVGADSGYSIKRSNGMVRITLPNSMAGATARVVDVRGRVIRSMTVDQTGLLNISSKDLATGMYFVDIRKPGVTTLKLPLRNIR